MVELGRVDIITEVSELASQLALFFHASRKCFVPSTQRPPAAFFWPSKNNIDIIAKILKNKSTLFFIDLLNVNRLYRPIEYR